MNDKKILSRVFGVAVLAGGVGYGAGAQAIDAESFSANIGVTSNYIWRGATQSDEVSVLLGGADFEVLAGESVSVIPLRSI